MPTTKKLAIPRQHERDGRTHRIGLIALDGDIATEADFHAMLPENAMFYTTRIRHTNPISVANLKRLGPQLTEAAEKLLPEQRLDVIAYSCTSGTAALGFAEVESRIRKAGRPGVAVVTPITAALAGFESFAVGSISLLTPHPDSVNQSTCRFFERHGIEVANVGSFCLYDDLAVASVSPQAIYTAALETFQQGADALFISSTALRAVETLERIEREIQKPVLTAVQCLFWQSLRLSGYAAPVPGFGRLMMI